MERKEAIINYKMTLLVLSFGFSNKSHELEDF